MTTLLALAALREECKTHPKEVYRSSEGDVMFVYELHVINGQLSLVRHGGPCLPEHFEEANRQLAKVGLRARLDIDSVQPHGTCCRVVALSDPIIPEGGFKQHELVILGTR